MRRLLTDEGYEQPYGTTDEGIRHNLQVSGPCADFIGYNPQTDRWLIAESKGSDLWSAEIQIANTLRALLERESEARQKMEVRIYTNLSQYGRLTQEPHGTGGYYRQEEFLGFKPDGIDFHYVEILGYRVRVLEAIGDER
jgi:hypothetical protein